MNQFPSNYRRPVFAPLAGRLFSALEQVGRKPVTQLRPAFVPPIAVRLAAMLREGKFDTLRFTISQLHRDSQRSSQEAMLDALNADERSERWLERLWAWYRHNREFHALTALIYGLIRHAWLKRGDGPAAAVGCKASLAFHEALEEAEGLLDQALVIQPTNVDLLQARLITARGLALGSLQSWTRFTALIDVDPNHHAGHLAMLENMKPKWGGTDEAMFKFARGRARQLPDGNALKALVLHAHFDMRQRWSASPAAKADEYFRQASVIDDIESAWVESIGDPQYRGDSHSEALYNLFAAAFYLTGQHPLARASLRDMGDYCLEWPWCSIAANGQEKFNPGWVVDRVLRELALPG